MLYIELYYEHAVCRVHDELPRSMNATLLAVAQRFWEECRIYAEDGTVWRLVPTEKPAVSFIKRMLAGLYNPTRPIAMSYEPIGRYTLADLKTMLGETVRGMYGDVWGEEAAHMEKQAEEVAEAESFAEIARIIREVCRRTG